jgi:RNA polymerase sigma-70 factor, ECF subfamily
VQAALVLKAKKGDREAFEVLAAGSVDRLYAVARLVLRDVDLAEDAVQETLISSWRGLPTLRDVERFDAWMYRLLIRACGDIGGRRREWRMELAFLRPEMAEDDPASDLADRDELERGLRHLNEAQRSILVLHFYLGLSVREAAEIMDIAVGTAKSRLHYALEALRAALEADSRTSIIDARGGRSA